MILKIDKSEFEKVSEWDTMEEYDNVERWVFDNRYAPQSVDGFCNANDSWKFFSANIQYGRQSVVQRRFCMDEKKQTLLRLNWVFHCIVLLMNKNKKRTDNAEYSGNKNIWV